MFDDGDAYHLADGAHFVRAAQPTGLTTLPTEVHMRNWQDALCYALGANRTTASD